MYRMQSISINILLIKIFKKQEETLKSYLKHGIDAATKLQADSKVREIVENILVDLEARGDDAAHDYSENR